MKITYQIDIFKHKSNPMHYRIHSKTEWNIIINYNYMGDV